jgi:hypothetical protein
MVTYFQRQMTTPIMNNPHSEMYGFNYIYKMDYKFTVCKTCSKKFVSLVIIILQDRVTTSSRCEVNWAYQHVYCFFSNSNDGSHL